MASRGVGEKWNHDTGPSAEHEGPHGHGGSHPSDSRGRILGSGTPSTRSWGFSPGTRLIFGPPIEVRLFGAALIVIGSAVAADVFRFRRPGDVWVSTSVTFMKLIGRLPLSETMARTEPFVPRGPYVYVRSPMYFGVVAITLGFGLAVGSLPLVFWGLVLACWYWFFLIPFEERELGALFGASYADYRRQVPKLFPYGRRYRQTEHGRPISDVSQSC